MKDGNSNDMILARIRELEQPIISFLRDIVALPSLSGREEAVVRRVAKEMHDVGFDEVIIDPLGNVLGRIGDGPRVIAFDAHLDTVDVTDRDQWDCDPFTGKLEEGKVFGRGSVDQKAGMAGMVYGGAVMKELEILTPELVVSTEPTGLRINRGQRGRMEIRVRVKGRSCHGSMPHLGDNAIYRIMPAVRAIEELNDRLPDDPFLGKGTCTVTWIGSQGPSLCAVPDKAELHIDRRLTTGETRESALAEVEAALADAGVKAEVFLLKYEEKAWTGLVYPMDKYYPTWVLDEGHPALAAAGRAFTLATGRAPEVSRWTFSTNGVAIMGLHGVPCFGFGPGQEDVAHTANEYVPVEDVLTACAFYAALPGELDGS